MVDRSDTRSVPATNALVEQACCFCIIAKHKTHILYVGCVPTRNILIEPHISWFIASEHIGHVYHLRNIPTTQIVVEIVHVLKGTFHVGHLRSIPAHDGNIIWAIFIFMTFLY